MTKKMLINISIMIVVLLLIISTVVIVVNNINNNKKEQNAKERYKEIKEDVKKGVEWMISAQYPHCPIGDKHEKKSHMHVQSRFLINNGYIKKEDILDIDEKSYCDVYVRVYAYRKEEDEFTKNCEMNYKIYLKCNDYEDKGYVDWGDKYIPKN